MARKRRAAAKRSGSKRKRVSNAKKSKKAEAEREQVEATVVESDSEPEAKKIKLDEQGSVMENESAAAPQSEREESETEVEMSDPEVNPTTDLKELEPEGQIETTVPAPSKEPEEESEAKAAPNGKESEPETDNDAAPKKESEEKVEIVDAASKEQVVGEPETGIGASNVKESESEAEIAGVDKASEPERKADTAAGDEDQKSEPVVEVETAAVEMEEDRGESTTVIPKPVAEATEAEEGTASVAVVREGGNEIGATLDSDISPMKTDDAGASNGSVVEKSKARKLIIPLTVDAILTDLEEFMSDTPSIGYLKAAAYIEKLRASFEAFFGKIIDSSSEAKAKEMKLLMAERGTDKFSAVADWKHLMELNDTMESGNLNCLTGFSGKVGDAQNVMNDADDLKLTAGICGEYFELTKLFMEDKLYISSQAHQQ